MLCPEEGRAKFDQASECVPYHLVLAMTCDHQLMVTSVEAKWPGLVHDSRIFQESSLGHRFEQGHYDGLLLGDRGYPCTRFLMTPYPDPQTPPERCFNVALSKCRVRIEMTFEVIKSRFNCLRGLRVSPERACQITTACMVLHNIATMRKERAPHVPLVAPDIVDPITPDHPTGAAIRQAITNHHHMPRPSNWLPHQVTRRAPTHSREEEVYGRVGAAGSIVHKNPRSYQWEYERIVEEMEITYGPFLGHAAALHVELRQRVCERDHLASNIQLRAICAILDTAAGGNVLPVSHFHSIPEEKRPSVLPSATEELEDVGPKNVPALGEAQLHIYVAGHHLQAIFLVADMITKQEFILDLSFLEQRQACIDYCWCRVELSGEVVPCFDHRLKLEV
eukprot:superscaffoldBa00001964_g12678